MRWGLILHWATDINIGAKMINAVCETAAERPVFKDAMRKRRCLIPADGFYEWKLVGPKKKQPYNIGMQDDSLFAFAGLWDRWNSPPKGELLSCTILTTDANPLLKDIHDRMPVIIEKDDYDLWLDPGMTDTATVAELLRPFVARLMRCYPVGNRVNHVQNDDAECGCAVAPEAPPQQQLFP